MKKIYFILLIVLISLQSEIQAQISNTNRFDTDKNTVYVDIQLPMTDYFVDDNEYLVLTPVIQSGDQTLDLLKVILYGKGARVSGTESGSDKPYAILNMMNRQNFVYQVDVTYAPWMDNSTLKLKRTIYSANGTSKQEFIQTISNTLARTNLVQNFTNQATTSMQEKLTFSALPTTLTNKQSDTRQYNGHTNSFEEQDGNVYINIRLRMTDYYVDNLESLILTPSIQADHKSLDLYKVILNGKNQMRSNIGNDTQKPYAVLNMINPADIDYRLTIPFESWMNGAKLNLKQSIYSANGDAPSYQITKLISNSLVSLQSTAKSDQANINSLQETIPVPEKQEFGQAQPITTNLSENIFVLQFSKKESNNVSDLTNNIALENLCKAIDNALDKNDKAGITIDITAGTCPYGIYYNNDELTKQQALAFKAYLEGRYNRNKLNINTQWISEDWPELVQLIQQDKNMPHKYEVINIINNTGIFTGREKALMGFAQGVPYRYMKDNIFPQLWKIECKIY